MEIKKKVLLGISSIIIGGYFFSGTSVSANEPLDQPEWTTIDDAPFTIAPTESTDINSEEMTFKIDLSEAKVYDKDGNELDKSALNNSDMISIMSGSTSGGNWQSGSGYRLVKGIKVTGHKGGLTITFKADFTNVNRGYDTLNRIYDIRYEGYGNVSIISSGVMRKKENASYSAYGGARVQFTRESSSGSPYTQTISLYLRVGKDKYWLTGTAA